MPVLIEDPLSFEIESILLVYPFFKDKTLSLIDINTGLEISSTLANIPEIGLTFQPTPDHKTAIGFPGVATPVPQRHDLLPDDDLNRPVFEPEAILLLDVDSIKLSKKSKRTWVIQVKHQKDEANYIKVAETLCEYFSGVTIIVTCAFKKNNSPGFIDGIPLDPKLKKGALYCPIGITRTKKAKEQAEINL